ncbi:YbaB/EbfC family nucleoid-associated protein [Nocardia puris]|uniref:DNA-binding protein YbaB n=1 Tax=Nocardia puris TaxID=208602 RepID=A0A366DFS7_9NOCA|nr:YbaB/EbfC family nucleoid-associated protein [Nocardia puris]RBO88930.1 DNA-binding protein YbaB [Nocardia puris]
MAERMAKAQLADLMDTVRSGLDSIVRAQREQARLTATAYAGGRRVRVTVNANGEVIETRFAPDVGELTHDEVAAAVTAAAQDAAAQVRGRTREIMDSLHAQHARMPKLSDFVPGIPDVQDMVPTPPDVPTSPPGAADRAADIAPGPEFHDVEQWDHTRPPADTGVHESGW